MSQTPAQNDSEWSLWYKAAQNLYDFVVSAGAVGMNPPKPSDNKVVLQKKCVYFTAAYLDI